MSAGLTAHGVPAAADARISALPPITILFATFLGYNPVSHLVGSKLLSQLPPASARALTGRSFFPNLISGPFHTGLHIAFGFSIACCLIAAVASWSRGSRYIAAEHEAAAAAAENAVNAGHAAVASNAVAANGSAVASGSLAAEPNWLNVPSEGGGHSSLMDKAGPGEPGLLGKAVHDRHVVGSRTDAPVDDCGHDHPGCSEEVVNFANRHGWARVAWSSVAGDIRRGGCQRQADRSGQLAQDPRCVRAQGW
jgi:hypothetical protein